MSLQNRNNNNSKNTLSQVVLQMKSEIGANGGEPLLSSEEFASNAGLFVGVSDVEMDNLYSEYLRVHFMCANASMFPKGSLMYSLFLEFLRTGSEVQTDAKMLAEFILRHGKIHVVDMHVPEHAKPHKKQNQVIEVPSDYLTDVDFEFITDWVSFLNELNMVLRIEKPVWIEHQAGEDHSPIWFAECNYGEAIGRGRGLLKVDAKKDAAKECIKKILAEKTQPTHILEKIVKTMKFKKLKLVGQGKKVAGERVLTPEEMADAKGMAKLMFDLVLNGNITSFIQGVKDEFDAWYDKQEKVDVTMITQYQARVIAEYKIFATTIKDNCKLRRDERIKLDALDVGTAVFTALGRHVDDNYEMREAQMLKRFVGGDEVVKDVKMEMREIAKTEIGQLKEDAKEELKKIKNATTEKVDQFTQLFNDSKAKWDTTVMQGKQTLVNLEGSMTAMMTQMKALMVQFGENMKTMRMIEKLIGTVVSLWALIRAETFEMRAYIIAMWTTLSGISSLVINTCVTSILELISKLTMPMSLCAQGEDDRNENIFFSIIPVFGRFFQKITPNQMKADKQRISAFSSAMKLVKDIPSYFKFVVEWMQMAIDWIWEQVTGYPMCTDTIKDTLINIQLWITQIHDILRGDYTKQMIGDPNFVARLDALTEQGDRFAELLSEIGYEKHRALYPFWEARREWAVVKESLINWHKMDHGRAVPVWVFFFGDPGIGKSVLQQATIQAVMNKLGMRFDERCIYRRALNSEYWEGYYGQFAVIIDDLFQIDIDTRRTDEAGDLMAMVNPETMHLNMAEISKKEKTFLTSRMVVTSTNAEAIPHNVLLESKEALGRRRAFVWKVLPVVKPTETESGHKRVGKDENMFDVNVWKFQRYHPTSERRLDVYEYTFEEMVDLAAKQVKENGKISANPTQYFKFSQDAKYLTEIERKEVENMILQGTIKIVGCRCVPNKERTKLDISKCRKHNILLMDDEECKCIPNSNTECTAPKHLTAQMMKREVTIVESDGSETDDDPMERDEDVMVGDMLLNNIGAHIAPAKQFFVKGKWEDFEFEAPRGIYEISNLNYVRGNTKRNTKMESDHDLFAGVDMPCCKACQHDNTNRVNLKYGVTGGQFIVHPGGILTIRVRIWCKCVGEIIRICYKSKNDIRTMHCVQVTGYSSNRDPKRVERMKMQAQMLKREVIQSDTRVDTSVHEPETGPKDTFQNVHVCETEETHTRAVIGHVVRRGRHIFNVLVEKSRDILKNVTSVDPKLARLHSGKIALGILAAALGVGALIYFKKDDKQSDSVFGQAKAYEHNRPIVRKVQRVAYKRDALQPQRQAQSTRFLNETFQKLYAQSSDRQALDLAQGKVLDNLCDLVLRSETNHEYVSKCTLLFGRTFVTAAHVFLAAGELKRPIEIKYREKWYKIDPKQIESTNVPTTDFLFVEILDKKFPEAHDIVDLHITDNEAGTYDPGNVAMLTRVGDLPILRQGKRSYITGDIVQYDYDGTPIEHANCVVGDFITEGGECSSPYLAFNTKLNHKILGYHLAGNGVNECVAGILTQEMIKEATGYKTPERVAQVGRRLPEEIKLQPTLGEDKPLVQLPQCENVEIVGTVVKEERIRQPVRSAISPSPIQGMFAKPTKRPAVLRPKEGKSPFEIGLKKFDREVNTYRSPNIERIKKVIINSLPAFPARVLTMQEGIDGVKGWQYLSALDTKTGAGFPWGIHTRGIAVGKGAYLVRLGDTLKAVPQLEKSVDGLILGYLGKGPRIPVVHQDCLKDELRLNEKVDEMKTRIFSAGPLHFLVTCRMYFGAFVECLMRNHTTHHVRVGVNPHNYYDWSRLYEAINKFGKEARKFAGDNGKMDASLCATLSEDIRQMIEEWYKRNDPNWKLEDEKVRKGLFEDANFGLHLAVNVLYRLKNGNNPSGWFLTTILNCFGVLIPYLDAVLEWAEKIEITDEMLYDLICAILDFGDDTVFSTPPQWTWLTMKKIAMTFKKYGMEYTDFRKNVDINTVDCHKTSELQFLKRSFRVDESTGIVFAPLDEDTIHEMENWISIVSTQDAWSALRANLDSAAREWFHHGRQTFEFWLTKYNTVLRGESVRPLNLDYDELLQRYLTIGKESYIGTLSGRAFTTIERQPLRAQVGDKPESGSMEQNQEVVQPAAETRVALTSFGDNVGAMQADAEVNRTITSVHNGSDPYPDQGLKQVLARPYNVMSGTWSAADVFGKTLFAVDFPGALVSVPNINAKLLQFEFLRAGVKVQMRINGTQFHYGQLLIVFVSCYQSDTSFRACFQNIFTASANPHVILSASTNTTASFVIPYVCPTPYWNMKDSPSTTAKGIFGTVYVFVLAPLRLIGSTTTPTLNITMHANFEDPQVAGPGLRGSTFISGTSFKAPLHAQVGEKKEQEVRSEKGTLSTAAAVTGEYLGKIGEVSIQAAKVATSISKLLPFNLPTTVSMPQPTYGYGTNMSYVRGSWIGEKVGAADPSNHVVTDHRRFGTDIDYNKFDEYKLLPAIILNGSYDSDDTPGQTVFAVPINPLVCFSYVTDVDTQIYSVTPIGNLASQFSWWRGGMKYCLRFCTGRNISSRVRLTWIPDPTFSGAIANDEEGDTISRIIDITGDTSYSFTIPYLANSHWTQVRDFASVEPPISVWEGYNGQIVMQIINPPASAVSADSGVVFFHMWMSGAEDFRCARPTQIDLAVYSDGTDPNPGPSTSRKGRGDFQSTSKLRAQVDTVTETLDMRLHFRKPFPSIIPATAQLLDGFEWGDSIDTWTDLMKRFTLLSLFNTPDAGQLLIDPWNLSNNDPWNNFYRARRGFLFESGSMRMVLMVHFTDETSGVNQKVTNFRYIIAPFCTDDATAENFPNGPEGLYMGTTRDGDFIRVEIPFHFPHPFVCRSFPTLHMQYRDRANTMQTITPLLMMQILGVNGASEGNQIFVDYYIAVGDDYTLGYPLAPVPVKRDLVARKRKDLDNNNTTTPVVAATKEEETGNHVSQQNRVNLITKNKHNATRKE